MNFSLREGRRLSLLSVLALALVLRLGVFLAAWWCAQDFSVFYANDTNTYLQPAAEFLTTGSFSTNRLPELMRTPGYPLLLALGLKLGQVEVITILLQILLSCLTCYLVYAIARQVFAHERAAVCAAFLFSLEPLSILHSCLLLSDTLFVFLVVAALHWLIRASREGRFGAWLLAAVAVAGATYTRPVAYFLPVVLALLLWANGRKDRPLRLRAAVFCLLAMSLVGVWQVRNQLTTGYAGFSTISEIVFYFYYSGAVKAQQQGVPFYQAVEQLGYYDSAVYFRNHPEQQTWTPGERYAYLRSEGCKTLREAPVLSAQIYIRGLFVLLLDPGVVEYLRLFKQYRKSDRVLNVIARQGVAVAAQRVVSENPSLVFWGSLLGLMLLSFYVLSLAGLKNLSLRAHLPVVILLGTGLYFIALSGGIVAVSRFRTPLMPILSVFAGQGLALAWEKAKNLGPSLRGLALKTNAQWSETKR